MDLQKCQNVRSGVKIPQKCEMIFEQSLTPESQFELTNLYVTYAQIMLFALFVVSLFL